MAYMKKMAMHESSNLISADTDQMSASYNAKLEREADTMLKTMALEAGQLLSQHSDKVERLAKELIAKETLDLASIKKLLNID